MALKRIGGLWVKKGKRGAYLSGSITVNEKEIRLMIFPNDKTDKQGKKNENRPDYSVHQADGEPKKQDDGLPF